jgi:hypothetical protein
VRANSFGCITIPFLLIALVPLTWGARGRWQDGELARHGESVDGQVVAVEYVPSNPSYRSNRASAMTPTVTFVTRSGEARRMVGSRNRGPAPWSVGDTVEVVYDPDNPARADLRTELDGWLLGFVIWCVVAVVPTAVAMAPVVLLLRQRRRASR